MDDDANTADFDHIRDDLLRALDESIGLLRRFGVTHWVEWLDGDRSRIAHGDRVGVDHLLSAFGGMGSLNDVVVHPLNGQQIDSAEVRTVNERLWDLRDQMWTAATAVRAHLDRQ